MSWWTDFFSTKTDAEKDLYNITVDTSSLNNTTMQHTTGYDPTGTVTINNTNPNNTYVTGGFYGTGNIQYTTPGMGYYNGTLGGSTSYQSGNIYIYGSNPSISTDKTKIDIDELGKLMETLRERLLIIVPNFEKHEKYEALKKAYDHYKLLEKMLGDDNVGNLPK